MASSNRFEWEMCAIRIFDYLLLRIPKCARLKHNQIIQVLTTKNFAETQLGYVCFRDPYIHTMLSYMRVC